MGVCARESEKEHYNQYSFAVILISLDLQRSGCALCLVESDLSVVIEQGYECVCQ